MNVDDLTATLCNVLGPGRRYLVQQLIDTGKPFAHSDAALLILLVLDSTRRACQQLEVPGWCLGIDLRFEPASNE